MSSVAYPVRPTEPGWWGTAWLLISGWLIAAIVLGVLYVAGFLVGAIGTSTGDVLPAGYGINDRPFAANGTWSLLADVAVVLVALVITTVAIASSLRLGFGTVSEGRLGLVLLFTGGLPYVTTVKSAPIFFVIALWLVRAWVVREELRFPRRLLAGGGAALVLTIASYGLAHPVWVESASAVISSPPAKRPVVMLVLHNAGRTSIEIERVSGGALFGAAHAGLPWEHGTRGPARIPAGQSRTFALEMRAGSCGTALIGAVHYRVFGRSLREPLRLAPAGLPGCS